MPKRKPGFVKGPGRKGVSAVVAAPDDRGAGIEPRRRPVGLVAGLLLAGAATVFFAGSGMHPLRWVIVALVVAVVAIGPVNRVLGRLLDAVRDPTPRGREWAGLMIGVVATCYLVGTAFMQDRGLFPRTEDDCSYVLGARMLAAGRLWLPAHPMADFFESFYVLVKPVYCSIYFPGAAMFFAPMVWLNWPAWVIPALLSGACVALVYRIVTELMDGTAGILAAFLLVSLRWFRMLSVVVMSHVPMLLLGLSMFWFYLRWRGAGGGRRIAWAAALGAAAGWGAITRPVDALALALPIGVGVVVEMVGKRESARLGSVLAVVSGAAPFLAIQLVFNFGVSGSVMRTPYTLYLDRNQPGSEFGIRTFDETLKPQTTLPGKLAFYDWCKNFLRLHQPDNFLYPWFHSHRVGGRLVAPNMLLFFDAVLPSRLLLAALPVGLLGLVTGRRIVYAASLLSFLGLYALNPFFIEHYAVVIAPVVILVVLLGCRELGRAFPKRVGAETVIWFGVLALTLTSYWEVYRFMPSAGMPAGDDLQESSLMTYLNVELPSKVSEPAVVLFRQSSQRIYFFEEPVYNLDAAQIDANPIIRAHDLGAARDAELIAYYAGVQPRRNFYLFDRDSGSLTSLGTAEGLAGQLRGGANPASLIQVHR